VQAVLLFTHSAAGASAFAWPLGLGATVGSLLIFATLRAEESRLARELRTARSGTPVLRALVARRRLELPFLVRWSASRLGTAAVHLADGDRDVAVDALRTTSWLMRGGRLETLRVVVEADLDRNTGTAVGLSRCVDRILAVGSLDNREADLYRIHVLVKAVLEQGDDDTAAELASELGASSDDDTRIYATWLRVWFELDEDASPDGPGAGGEGRTEWPPISEGDLRMATLAARAHGAASLVSKLSVRLSTRLSTIARAEARG
jgi:hypothetical protein